MSTSHHDHAALPLPYLQEVSDGIYAYVQPDGSWFLNNTGFLVGRRGRGVDRHHVDRAPHARLPGCHPRRDRPPRAHADQHAPPWRSHAWELSAAAGHDHWPPAVPRGDAAGGVSAARGDLRRRRLGGVSPRATVRDLRRAPDGLRRRPPRGAAPSRHRRPTPRTTSSPGSPSGRCCSPGTCCSSAGRRSSRWARLPARSWRWSGCARSAPPRSCPATGRWRPPRRSTT